MAERGSNVQNDKALTIPPADDTSALVRVNLPPDKAAQVPEIVAKFDVATVPGTALVTFGQQPVAAFSAQLDAMLEQVTKADSPVLFELFRQVSTGVKQMNLPELDLQRDLALGT